MKYLLSYLLFFGLLTYTDVDLLSQGLGSIYQDHIMQNSNRSNFRGSISSPVVFTYTTVAANSSVIHITSPRLSDFTLVMNDSVTYEIVKQSYQDLVIIENVPAGMYRLKAIRKKKWPFRGEINAETLLEAKGEGERVRWLMPRPRYSFGATALQVGCGLGVLAVFSSYGRTR